MRLSAEQHDPGHGPLMRLWEKNRVPEVLLDGNPIQHCKTADEELGYVVRYQRDELGDYRLDPEKREVLTEQLFGHVQIVPPETENKDLR